MTTRSHTDRSRRIRLGDLSVGFVHSLVLALRELQVDPQPLLARFGLDAERLATPRARLSIPRYMRLGHAAIALSGDPALGLRMGRHSRLAQAGLAGVAAALAPSLGEAMRTLVRFEPLYAHNYRGRSSLSEDSDGAWLNFYSISPYNAYNRFVVESVLAGWLHQLAAALGEPLAAERVEIEFAAPAHVADYLDCFAGPVEFGCAHNRLRLDRRQLDRTLPGHCPGTWQQLLELAEQELLQLTRTRSLREQVIQLLGPMLHGREPALDDLAARLQMPGWTLQRRLAAEGCQFRQLLNDTRRDLALAYIRDTELSFGEIAYLLGFASAEAFQRAFRRWTGHPPGQERREQRLQADT